MQFLSSWFLVLLAVVPALLALYVWQLRRRRPIAARYSSLLLVREALPGSSRLRRHAPFVLLLASIASLALAVARPAAIVPVPANQVTIVLALDVSGSMCSTDIEPSRLVAAEQAASSFVESQGAGTQIGVVAFSGFAELVQAPTDDREVLLDVIRNLATGRRTAIGSGILTSIDAIAEVDRAVARSERDPTVDPPVTPVPKGAYVPDIVVLLTDGANNYGPEPLDAAQQAVDRGIRVFTIGFGTAAGGAFNPECAPQFVGREPIFGGGGGGPGLGPGGFRRGIDEDTLKQVADKTGGTYYPAETAAQLQDVFRSLPTYLITRNEVMEVSVGFVALGVLLAAAAVLLGQAWRPLP
jgi:Ca-activated chloride channel family protein